MQCKLIDLQTLASGKLTATNLSNPIESPPIWRQIREVADMAVASLLQSGCL